MTTAATNNQAFFGSGTLILRDTNIANVTPTFLGVLQDITIDLTSKNVDLVGQQRFPVDTASGPLTIKGKAKSAIIKATLPNLLFGSTISVGGGSLLETGVNGAGEIGTIPASSTYTITVANAMTFLNDQGVCFSANGAQLQLVASSPTQGQYSVVNSTGVYTFAAADASAGVFIYYSYTSSTSGQGFTQSNTLMGSVTPNFEMFFQNSSSFQGNANAATLHLYACKADKLSLNFSNEKWMIPDFEFSAYQAASGKVFDWNSTN